MDTVNISVPDTEKVINYSPNYYRRLNVILARYNKRSVCVTFVVVFVYNSPFVRVYLWGQERTACNENSCCPHY